MSKKKFSKSQFRAVPKPCAYCGAPSSTKDHVIPKLIFNDAGGDHKITVRSCDSCNQRKKRYDEFLRDYLASDHRTRSHPLARSKFDEEVFRAAVRGQSELIRRVIREASPLEFVTQAGLYVGTGGILRIDEEITGALSYIVRGLTAHYKRGIVDPNARIEIGTLDNVGRDLLWGELQRMSEANLTVGSLGHDVCFWANQWADTNNSIWLVGFYGRLFFMVTVQSSNSRLEETATAA